MSESDATESAPAPKAPKPAASSPKAAEKASPKAAGGAALPPWITLVALVLGLAGVVLGAIGLFFPSDSAPKYSDQQKQDAKAAVCEAAGRVNQAVQVSTHMQNQDPGNPASGMAIASNARLGLYAGGGYLRARIDQNPAAPAELTETVSQMANTLQELSLNYLGNAADPVQQPLREELNARIGELQGLCQ